MKKAIVIVSVLVLIGLLLLGCGGAKVSELEAKITALEGGLKAKTDEAADLQKQLSEKDQEISNLNDKLTAKDGQITDLGKQINGKDVEISNLNDKLTAKDDRITDLNGQIGALEKQVTELQAKIPQLKDPTYEETVAFIKADKTNEEIPFDYALAAIITAENAAKQGINSYWVVARLAGGIGYNFTGFNTTDKGWLYFAATADFEAKLVEKEKYHLINNGSNPGFDDTIISLHYLPTH